MAKTIKWIEETLEETDVVAANWEYGNQLNVLGGVKTIIGLTTTALTGYISFFDTSTQPNLKKKH